MMSGVRAVAGGNGGAEPSSDPALPRTLDLEIDPPVDWNGNTYSSMHLEEPTARMVERAEAELASGVTVHTLRKYQVALVSHGSGWPRGVIEQMRISQVQEAATFLSGFLQSGPETGAT